MKKVKSLLKKYKKFVIGLIIGIVVSGTTVYAATILYASDEVSYDNTTSGLTDENNNDVANVQTAIDALYKSYRTVKSSSTCPTGAICQWKKSWSEVAVGDYVQMTPNPGTLDSSNRYATDTSKTGYSSVQYIYPKQLNLWRVIKKNTDGTIEMVSEYVSSTNVYFGTSATGTTGDTAGVKAYANFVGYLNTLANQYQNPTYTISARHMGYNGQTEVIEDTSAFDGTNGTSAPWTSSTTSTLNKLSSNESLGGGDTMYAYDTAVDTGLVQVAYGNVGSSSLIAKKCNDTSCSNPTTATAYWLASRRYDYSSSSFSFYGRYVNASGSIVSNNLRNYSGGSWGDYSRGYALRPIVTLKSGLNPEDAVGTIDNPFVLE